LGLHNTQTGVTQMHWYHIETTLRDGTTWKSTSPIGTLAKVAEWIATSEYESEIVRVEVKRYDD